MEIIKMLGGGSNNIWYDLIKNDNLTGRLSLINSKWYFQAMDVVVYLSSEDLNQISEKLDELNTEVNFYAVSDLLKRHEYKFLLSILEKQGLLEQVLIVLPQLDQAILTLLVISKALGIKYENIYNY